MLSRVGVAAAIASLLMHAGAQAEPRSPRNAHPAAAQAQRPPAEAQLRVERIIVEGNTTIPESIIREIAAPFAGRALTADDLEDLRRKLTLAYVDRGYVSSGVILPEQNVANGTVTFRVIEGHVTGIDVTGHEHLSPDWLIDRLTPATGSPININTVQDRVQLLLQNPSVSSLNVVLVPDTAPGETRVRVNLKEAPRYALIASLANDEPPSIGSIHGDIAAGVRNLVGVGDLLTGHYGRTEGANLGGLSYAIPLSASDTTLTVRYEYNGAGVISSEYQGLGIKSVVQTGGLTVTQPLYRSLEQTLSVSGTLDHIVDQTYLLGDPFSFSSGFKNGQAAATVIRIGGDWIDRSVDQVIALRATVSRGLPILGATNERDQVNADFFTFLGQAQYVHSLFGRSQIMLRAAGQIATKPLFNFEQFSLGGPSTVRGYVQNALLYDNGVIASMELRVPFARLKLPYVSSEETDGELEFAPFIDYGHGWNNNLPGNPQAISGTLPPLAIASVGVGLRWQVAKNAAAQIYYGRGLNPIPSAGHDGGRNAITFNVTTQLY